MRVAKLFFWKENRKSLGSTRANQTCLGFPVDPPLQSRKWSNDWKKNCSIYFTGSL
jgi:hypothetical protein